MLSFFSSRWNWDSPNPSPARDCAPRPFGSGGRGTLACERESQFRRGDIHCGTLYVLFGINSSLMMSVMLQGRAPVPPAPPDTHRSHGHRLTHHQVEMWVYTDKKEHQIFLINKETQSGAVAKSYMRKGFRIYEKMHKYFPIYEEAVRHLWLCNCSILNFLLYEENLLFFFISGETCFLYFKHITYKITSRVSQKEKTPN